MTVTEPPGLTITSREAERPPDRTAGSKDLGAYRLPSDPPPSASEALPRLPPSLVPLPESRVPVEGLVLPPTEPPLLVDVPELAPELEVMLEFSQGPRDHSYGSLSGGEEAGEQPAEGWRRIHPKSPFD
jgi:hypothetical protein